MIKLVIQGLISWMVMIRLMSLMNYIVIYAKWMLKLYKINHAYHELRNSLAHSLQLYILYYIL